MKEQGKEIVFLRKIIPYPADKSYGIQVARLAGLPNSVIDRAELILKSLEKTDKQEVKLVGTALKIKKDYRIIATNLIYFKVNTDLSLLLYILICYQ